eukprot:Tamp_08804.p3 GENE.Tamp_08804~~Tamp_08804.p3  ORF type:complete len:164 (-),score=0.19 Tamp_08804:447-938(-)
MGHQKTRTGPVHLRFAMRLEQRCLVCTYVDRGCQPEPRGRRAANCKDGARISLRKFAVFSCLACTHRGGVGVVVALSCTKLHRGEAPYHIGVLHGPLHFFKPPLAWKTVTIQHDGEVETRLSQRQRLADVPSIHTSQVDCSPVVRVFIGGWHVANCDHVLPDL